MNKPTDWEKEFDNLPLEERDVYPPREESCKICRDYSNHAHGPSQEAIGYNQCLEKIIPVFKSFIRTKIRQAKEEGRKEVLEDIIKIGGSSDTIYLYCVKKLQSLTQRKEDV